jgi:hypothetical protein
LRSIEAAEDLSSSPNAPVYCEPSPLVAVSNHKTLELETVKLAENIDPRKLATEMRLGRVAPSLVPPSDSGWPAETALTSSTPPDGPGRRRRLAPLVLCALLGALLVLVLARAAAHRSTAAVGAPITTTTALPLPVNVEALAPPLPIDVEAPAPLRTVNAEVPAPPVASAVAPESAPPTPSESTHAASNAPPHSAKHNPQPAAREPLVAPSPSKPKRAIY